MVAVALGFSSVAAENKQSPSLNAATQATPAGGKGAAAMQQAASANKYLFAFFYEKDDAAKENPARSANPNPATFEHWMRPVTVHAHELLT